jgi:hypothetical protein
MNLVALDRNEHSNALEPHNLRLSLLDRGQYVKKTNFPGAEFAKSSHLSSEDEAHPVCSNVYFAVVHNQFTQ